MMLELAGRLYMAGEIPGHQCCRPPDEGGGGGAVALGRRDGSEIWLPATPPAVCAKNTWVSLGTRGSAFIVSQVLLTGVLSGNPYVRVEIASGAAQVNPRDCLFGGVPFFNPGETTVFYWGLGSGLRPVAIPAGEEIWAKVTTGFAGDPSFKLVLLGWDGALPTWTSLGKNDVAGPGRNYPNNNVNTGVAVLTGASWAWGSTAEVVASAPNDFIVTGVPLGLLNMASLLNPLSIFQLGVGAAGVETWCALSPMGYENGPQTIWPPVHVKVGERLAIRGAGNTGVNLYPKVKVYDL